MPRAVSLFASLLLAACFLASCGGGSSLPATTAIIKGFAIADAPIVGATISVTDKDGNEVATAAATSNQHGAFMIGVSGPPQAYIVTAKDGSYGGKPFKGSLRTSLDAGFDPHTAVAYLTPVTTLATAYRAVAPGVPAQQADANVKRFLSLPSHVAIAKSKRQPPRIFSAAKFMNQATAFQSGAASGFDPYVAGLAREIEGGAPRVYVLAMLAVMGEDPVEAAEANLAVQLLQWALKNLAGGAVGAVGSKTFSTILGAAGAGGTDLGEVQAKLDEISTQISTLENQVQGLQSTLGCDVTTAGYDDLVAGFQPKLNLVGTVQGLVDHLSKMDATDPGYANAQADIRSSLQANLSIHNDVYTFIAGTAALDTRGAIRGLGAKLSNCGDFFNAGKSDAITTQYVYLANVLAGACQMVVMYFNDRNEVGAANDASTACTGTYIPGVAALVTPNSIPSGSSIVIDTRYNLMWWNFSQMRYPAGAAPSSGEPAGISLHDLVIDAYYQSGGKNWLVPNSGQIGSFLTPCFGTNADNVKKCLADKGWGTYDAGSGTSASFYGDGAIFFWLYDYQSAYIPTYASMIMAYTGKSETNHCTTCYATPMLVRDASAETYWRK